MEGSNDPAVELTEAPPETIDAAVEVSEVEVVGEKPAEKPRQRDIKSFFSGRHNLAKLLQIMLVVQPASAEVERGFSAMNLIKDTNRTRLLLPSLDVLMRIAINGPRLSEFEPLIPAVLKVWNAGRRVPQRSCHGKRPSRAKTHMVEGGVLDPISGITLPI